MKDDGLLPGSLENPVEIYVMPMGEIAKPLAIEAVTALRLSGYRTDFCFEDVKLGNMFKRAERKGARFAVIIGENEVNNGKVIVKNLKTQEQLEFPIETLREDIDNLFYESEHECCCGDDCDCDCEEEGHECHCHCHDKKEN